MTGCLRHAATLLTIALLMTLLLGMEAANAQARFSCDASANPTSGQAPLTVQFEAIPSGGVPPYSFQWIFGDGEQSKDQNPSHAYEKPGIYGWSLNAYDSSGQGVIAFGTITVTPGQSSIYLESVQDDGATKNLGSITFDGSTYSLPVTISKDPGKYEVTYNPIASSSFVKWETSGDVSVSDAGKQTTTAIASGSGTLRAIYKSSLSAIHLDSLEDDGATSSRGSITFDGVTYSLPADIFKDTKDYEAKYNPDRCCTFVEWKASGEVAVVDPNSQTTKVTVKGSGFLTAIYKSDQPPSPDIRLESRQDDAATSNKGSITFDEVIYLLPTDIFKDPREYEAKYNPTGSTSFVRWETSGGVSVSDPNSETTKVTAKASGTLNAIYASDQSDFPPVGGQLMSVNRFAALGPYLALLGLVGFGSTLYIITKIPHCRCRTGQRKTDSPAVN